jgi:hypothetical protein
MSVITPICIELPQLLAGFDVEKRHDEKRQREKQHD